MEEMLVSVIIPVPDGERFVGQTLDSAFWANIWSACIVVVDGSTDQTSAVVEAAANHGLR
jgi:glycosyltransferase involved in cell wall biosynthesis